MKLSQYSILHTKIVLFCESRLKWISWKVAIIWISYVNSSDRIDDTYRAESSQSLQKRLPIPWFQYCVFQSSHEATLNFIIFVRKEYYFKYKVENVSARKCYPHIHEFINLIYYLVLPELLFNQVPGILYITRRLRVKERDSMHTTCSNGAIFSY